MKKTLGFGWSKKAKITLEIISFWQIISINNLNFVSIIIYNESLSMKSYKFFKICRRIDKEREKNTYVAVNEKRKTKKCQTFLIQVVL